MNREEKTALLNEACKPVLGTLKGKKMPYQSCNTYMVAFIGADNSICLRMPKETFCEASQLKTATHPIEYGSTMKGFVIVPDDLLTQNGTLKKLLQAAVNHTNSLKPQK